jgi:hypothetical protein
MLVRVREPSHMRSFASPEDPTATERSRSEGEEPDGISLGESSTLLRAAPAQRPEMRPELESRLSVRSDRLLLFPVVLWAGHSLAP